MGLIYLIRHPSTQPDERRPARDWRLSAEGHEQLGRLLRASWWPTVRHVYVSDEHKAATVGDAAAKRFNVPVSRHPEIGELRRAPSDGVRYEELVRQTLRQPDEPPRGWESLSEARRRAVRFLQTVVSKGPLPAAVVSHGIVLSAVRAHLLGADSVDEAAWASLPFAAVAEVETDGWRLRSDFTA